MRRKAATCLARPGQLAKHVGEPPHVVTYQGPLVPLRRVGLALRLRRFPSKKSRWAIADNGLEIPDGSHRWTSQDCRLVDVGGRILVSVDVMRHETGRDKDLAFMRYVEVERTQLD